MKNNIEKINNKLIKRFGIPKRQIPPPEPVSLLIAAILSQNTNDKNSYHAFENLKNSIMLWEDIAEISLLRIEKLIRPAGLPKQKAKAIKEAIISIIKRNGEASLNYLRHLSVEESLKELTSLNGVGVKTASCVLLFSLGKNICPVDVHVHRTLNRIGFVKTSAPDKTFIEINRKDIGEMAHAFHTNLIRLGREVCRPKNPACGICPLNKVCKYEGKIPDNRKNMNENTFMLLDNVESLKSDV